MSKRKNLKATVASLLAATLLTGNIGAIQPRWEITITESIVNVRILTAKAAESQKGKVNVKLASKKKKSDEYIPFGPFIVIASFISIFVPFVDLANVLLKIFTLGM